jgi:hypothetical protein
VWYVVVGLGEGYPIDVGGGNGCEVHIGSFGFSVVVSSHYESILNIAYMRSAF